MSMLIGTTERLLSVIAYNEEGNYGDQCDSL